MVQIGRFNRLQIVRWSPQGPYLGAEHGDILLPEKYAPTDADVGDWVEVFIYLDSEERLIATTQKPKAEVDQFAALRVINTMEIGAFLDWGLDKDLLVPLREQGKNLEEGDIAVVRVCLEEGRNRLYATNKLNQFLSFEEVPYRRGQQVELLISNHTGLGAYAIVESTHSGFIYRSTETEELPAVGTTINGYVVKVRDDGKIDLTLKAMGITGLLEARQKILNAMAANDGHLDLTDDSSPEAIKDLLDISKKSFKRALGILKREDMVILQESRIELNPDPRPRGRRFRDQDEDDHRESPRRHEDRESRHHRDDHRGHGKHGRGRDERGYDRDSRRRDDDRSYDRRPRHRDDERSYDRRPRHRDDEGSYDKRPRHRDDERSYDKRPRHRDDERSYDKRPRHRDDERSYDKRPRHRDDERSYDKRPRHRDDERSYDKRPRHRDDERSYDKRPRHRDDERSSDRRPRHRDDERSYDRRPRHRDDERSSDRRPRHRDDDRSYDKRPRHRDDERSYDKRPRHRDDERSYDRRPRHRDDDRSYDKRPRHRDDERSYDKRPRHRDDQRGGERRGGERGRYSDQKAGREHRSEPKPHRKGRVKSVVEASAPAVFRKVVDDDHPFSRFANQPGSVTSPKKKQAGAPKDKDKSKGKKS